MAVVVMDKDKLWGYSKLKKGFWKRRLDDTGHAAIAFGSGLLVLIVLAFQRWRLWLCMVVGAGFGTGVLGGREIIQLALSGSPHIWDRLLDIAPGPAFGALGGLACYYAARRFFSRS